MSEQTRDELLTLWAVLGVTAPMLAVLAARILAGA